MTQNAKSVVRLPVWIFLQLAHHWDGRLFLNHDFCQDYHKISSHAWLIMFNNRWFFIQCSQTNEICMKSEDLTGMPPRRCTILSTYGHFHDILGQLITIHALFIDTASLASPKLLQNTTLFPVCPQSLNEILAEIVIYLCSWIYLFIYFLLQQMDPWKRPCQVETLWWISKGGYLLPSITKVEKYSRSDINYIHSKLLSQQKQSIVVKVIKNKHMHL